MHDTINHPKHYTSHPSGIECIDVTKHFDFVLGNIIKYAWRAGNKENTTRLEDLQKMLWYAGLAVAEEMKRNSEP